MKQITIRGIPYDIEKIIKKESVKKGLSINKTLLAFLEKATGIKTKNKKILYHDLDPFCGIWTKNEEKHFTNHLMEQRKIDALLWKKTVTT